MPWVASLFIVAAAGSHTADTAAVSRTEVLASAPVTVEILRPVIVRQTDGSIEARADTPRPQVTRRASEILFEFQ